MILSLIERSRFREINDLAVNACAKALLVNLIKEIFKLALATSHDGRHDGNALSNAELQDSLDDLLCGLASNRAAAIRAVRGADRGVEQAEVVVDLSDGADGGTGTAAGGFLFDRDCRRKTFDGIHVRSLDLIQELACIRGKGLDVATLSLGIDCVEGERTLP